MGRKVLGAGGDTAVLPAGVLTLRGRDAIAELRAAGAGRAGWTATLVRKLHVAARVTAEGGLRETTDRHSADEVAAAMGWSASVAGRWVEFADDLVLRLPRVLAAMGSGSLGEDKARVFSEWTRDLSTEHAGAVADTLLGYAPQMPVGALVEAVVATAIEVDPGFAARREARARRRARVVGSVTPDGTASLSGYDLPLEEAVEAKSRVEALADRVAARGVDIPIGELRAIVFLRSLTRFGAGLDDAALVAALVAALRVDPGPDDRGPDGPAPDGPAPDGPHDGGPDDGPDDSFDDDDPAPADPAPADPAPEDPAPADPAPEDPAPRTRGRRTGVTELRVGLATVLGLDERPGHLTLWGPLVAARAREWVARHPEAEWRIVVVDHYGRLLHVLLTRHRPPDGGRRGGAAGSVPRGIVELQVPRVLLAGLTPASFPAWAGLLGDAQRRVAVLPREGCPDLRAQADDAAGRRRARAELDRWVRVRDRWCAMAGCRRPALQCDLDHTRAWAEYGPSAAWNLGALCRRHHRMKHVGGWRLTQPEPGVFVWRSRAGMTYLVGARTVMEPAPRVRLESKRRPLAREKTCAPPRRGLTGVPDADRPRPRTVLREDRPGAGITYVGGRAPTFPDEPPF